MIPIIVGLITGFMLGNAFLIVAQAKLDGRIDWGMMRRVNTSSFLLVALIMALTFGLVEVLG